MPERMRLISPRQSECCSRAAPHRSARGPGRRRLAALPSGRSSLSIAAFTLQETLVATVIGTLVIGGAGVVLQSSLRRVQQSSTTALSRDSNASALALVRADVTGSKAILFRLGSDSSSGNLDGSAYAERMASCQALAGGAPFNPVFGLLRPDSDLPVIYGLGLGRNGTSYALQRCGPPALSPGSSTSLLLSPVIEGIAPVPCADSSSACPTPSLDATGSNPALSATLLALSNSLGSDNTTPVRSAGQPAFRIRTDDRHHLLELIDPTADTDGVVSSFTSADPTGVKQRAPLYLTARVSSDAITPPTPQSTTIGTFFGIPVSGLANRSSLAPGYVFVIDRSEAMSTCSIWGVISGNSVKDYFNPKSQGWFRSGRGCLQTRISAVQSQMLGLVNRFPDGSSVTICLVSKSNDPCQNFVIPAQRDSLSLMINKDFDAGNTIKWGDPANPWTAVNLGFDKSETVAIYHVTAGVPSQSSDGSAWPSPSCNADGSLIGGAESTKAAYVVRNSGRVDKLSYNTVAMSSSGLCWMQPFSAALGGTFVNNADDPQPP